MIMKKIFLFISAAFITLSTLAHDFAVNGIYYNNLEGNNVEVTYRGTYSSAYDNEYSSSVMIPASVTYNGNTYSVTSIGGDAFSGCSSLTSVSIPNSVTSIGSYAFSYCSGLTSITIPNSVTSIGSSAFSSCTSLTSVTVGESVMSIGDKTFYGCSSLTSVSIPSGVTSIGEKAFSGCSSLPLVNIPSGVTSIGKEAFEGCSSLTSVIWNAKNFENGSPFYEIRSQITSFVFGDSVEYISTYLCSGMNNLTSITIPNRVTSIGDKTFSGCSSLTSVIIPNSVTSIGFGAFSGCSSLTSVSIPNSVTNIEQQAFSGCSSLTSVAIGHNVTSIGSNAFYDCPITSVEWNAKRCEDFEDPTDYMKSKHAPFYNREGSQITSFTFGNDVEYTPAYLCYGMNKLNSITLPNSVTSIGNYAFERCSSLTSITIPNSVTSIGVGAFAGSSSLTSVTIPSSLTNIGYMAFTNDYWGNYNSNIKSITLTATNIEDYCKSKINYLALQSIGTAPRKLVIAGKEIDDLVVPSTIDIYDYLFYACTGLKFVTIPNGIRNIGVKAFYNCSSLTSITIPNSVKNIDDHAFSDCVRLGEVSLGYGLEKVTANAFAGCNRLYDIYCYAAYPPFAEESSFANYNVYLFIPCESKRDYELDIVWGKFKFIECIGAESEDMEGEGVVITPGSTDVTITWPTEGDAETYTIVIKKGDAVFCTLTFNKEGLLMNIAFAPGRNGNHAAQYAERAANGGYRFTVTSLEEDTKYGYNLDVKNGANKTIKSYSGEFTTGETTSVEDIITNDNAAQKFLRNGQLIILRDGKEYNVLGAKM